MSVLERSKLFNRSRYRGRLVIDCFWDKVEKSEYCWWWIGANKQYGYGRFCIDGENFPAHRVAWTFANGEIPEGFCVAHRCDNKLCVNPEHLFLATNKENSEDMVWKERQAYGERNGQAVLTENEVKEILDSNESQRVLGEKYGVHYSTIYLIKARKKWKYIGEQNANVQMENTDAIGSAVR